MRDSFNGCCGMSIFPWLKERYCWKRGLSRAGVPSPVCFIPPSKLAILDLTLGEVSTLVTMPFMIRCKIFVSSIRGFSASGSFCGGHRPTSPGDLTGGATSLNFSLGGSVLERLLGWTCSASGAIGPDRYTVGAVLFSSKDEEDEERMLLITTEALYRWLEDLESFRSGVTSLDVEDIEAFAALAL